MSINNIIEEAMHLKPQERYLLVENLINSLNEPNKIIDDIWIEESKKRLNAYRQGKLKTVNYEQVFGS